MPHGLGAVHTQVRHMKKRSGGRAARWVRRHEGGPENLKAANPPDREEAGPYPLNTYLQ